MVKGISTLNVLMQPEPSFKDYGFSTEEELLLEEKKKELLNKGNTEWLRFFGIVFYSILPCWLLYFFLGGASVIVGFGVFIAALLLYTDEKYNKKEKELSEIKLNPKYQELIDAQQRHKTIKTAYTIALTSERALFLCKMNIEEINYYESLPLLTQLCVLDTDALQEMLRLVQVQKYEIQALKGKEINKIKDSIEYKIYCYQMLLRIHLRKLPLIEGEGEI